MNVAPTDSGAPPDEELIVLVDDEGNPVGSAPKIASHHSNTPLHLAFSAYVFDRAGRFLITRRGLDKKTWPGVWTNSCCGHPAPGEESVAAVRRRLTHELGLEAADISLLLPKFRYRAEHNGVVENEICPVYGVRTEGEPRLNPEEVAEYRWLSWSDVLNGRIPGTLSPWCQLQLPQLAAHPGITALRTPAG